MRSCLIWQLRCFWNLSRLCSFSFFCPLGTLHPHPPLRIPLPSPLLPNISCLTLTLLSFLLGILLPYHKLFTDPGHCTCIVPKLLTFTIRNQSTCFSFALLLVSLISPHSTSSTMHPARGPTYPVFHIQIVFAKTLQPHTTFSLTKSNRLCRTPGTHSSQDTSNISKSLPNTARCLTFSPSPQFYVLTTQPTLDST